eukprot:NODE_34_length_31639_cov_0.254375.p20 type:complete len:144 gc:universal NODE_34_length_31639_cov_0.254375:15670-16101(+)
MSHMDHDMGNSGSNDMSSNPSGTLSMGAMGMYFNFQTTDFHILFEFWHVTSIEIFIASLLIIGFISFINEIFGIHIKDLVKILPEYERYSNPMLLFIKMFLNAVLMLAMMTFNGYLVIIIVAAKVLAHVIFPGRFEELTDCHE